MSTDIVDVIVQGLMELWFVPFGFLLIMFIFKRWVVDN